MGVPQNTGPAWVDEAATAGAAFNSSSPAVSPFLVAAHGALYLFQYRNGTGGSNVNGCGFYKSTDDGNTWALLDSANTPLNATGAIVYDPANDRIICGLVVDTSPQSQQTLYLKNFALNGGAGEAWGGDYATGGPVCQTLVQLAYLRSDGTVVLVYDLGAGNNPGGTTRMRAAAWDGIGWTGSIDVGAAILPAQAAGNILVAGAVGTIDPATDVIHLAFGNSTAADFVYQQLNLDNSLGQSDTFTAASLGISGNSFRNMVLFHDILYLPFPANSFTDNRLLTGTPSAAPAWSQITPSNMSQGVGFVNRANAIAADSSMLYWMVSFFDAGTGTFVAFQLWTSSDDGATWAEAPGNDAANWFYNFDTGGSVQAPHALPIFGNPGLLFSLVISGGVTTVYGLTQVRNSTTGIFQSYLLNLQEFSVAELELSGTPPGGTVGTAYGFCFVASGGVEPYTFSLDSGAVPSGTSLDASTGCITGTPTAAGTFCFVLRVTDDDSNFATLPACITIVAGSLIVQLIGWKLYPDSPCAAFEESAEIPKVKQAV